MRSLFLAFSLLCLMPLTIGCGGGVDETPATGEVSDDDGATSDMTEEEVSEFEAGEG